MQFIKPTEGLVTSLFSKNRKHPVLAGVIRPHQGVDFGTHGANDKVIASAAGIVRVHPFHKGGAGNYVSINHGNGWTTGYLHLKSVSVRTGQRVSQGQVIGIKGNTGIGTGVHLHFEIQRSNGWTNDFNKKVDPLLYIVDPTTKQWQGWLKDLGYYNGSVDGIYGDGAVKAVTEYQRKNGLMVDGVCGRGTYNHIKNNHNKLPNKPSQKPSQKPNNKGELSMSQYTELKDLIGSLQRQVATLRDDKNKKMPATQRKDLKELFKYAFDKGIFTVNHVSRVDSMTQEEALNLVLSYISRTIS